MTTKSNQESLRLYEVIRIINGIPLFLEDHLDRLYSSARLMRLDHLMPDRASLILTINHYLFSRSQKTGNIKLSFLFNDGQNAPQIDLRYIDHYYPTPQEFSEGVKVGLLSADRPVPGAKIQHAEIRDRADEMRTNQKLFEVLLCDQEGNITEGSRSNVFFIKNETLYSAPEAKILQGITRMKLLQQCAEAGIHVVETSIPASTLAQYEAAFLTGTSIKVLPIRSVDDLIYRTDLPVLLKLQDLCNHSIDTYIRETIRQQTDQPDR